MNIIVFLIVAKNIIYPLCNSAFTGKLLLGQILIQTTLTQHGEV